MKGEIDKEPEIHRTIKNLMNCINAREGPSYNCNSFLVICCNVACFKTALGVVAGQSGDEDDRNIDLHHYRPLSMSVVCVEKFLYFFKTYFKEDHRTVYKLVLFFSSVAWAELELCCGGLYGLQIVS